MNYRLIFYLSGQILRVLGILMLLPLVTALIYNEPASRNAFAITALVLVAAGTLITLKKPENKSMYNREGLATVAIAWLLVSLFGAIPFFLSGEIPNFADCIFEMTSGFTTTGSTVLTDIEAVSKSCLMWRSFSHFLGGMGVLVFMLAVLPHNDTRTMHIIRAESPGPTVGKLVSKMSFSVRILYGMYVALTVVMVILLLFGGMNFFEALCYAFASAGTGGFGLSNASVGEYDSLYIEIVISVFLTLFSLNFTLFYLLLTKKFMQVFKNEELRLFLGICAVSIIAIALNIMEVYGSFWTGLRHSVFQVFSIISTTGYSTVNYTEWPFFSQILLILLMCVGGCAGSTGGGLKVMRILLLAKISIKGIRSIINPRAVISIKYDGKSVDKDVVQGVTSYFIIYIFLLAASTVILSLDGKDLATTFTAIVTCLNNAGPGLGMIDPSGNFSGFSDWAVIFMSFVMLLGRLEVYPLLVLFTIRRNK